MLIFSDRAQLSQFIHNARCAGHAIGFVPTMGALHKGHASLLQAARRQNEVVVCSIFVNPTQFNNADDFTHYPKTLEPDLEMCRQAGADAVFVPTTALMYPQKTVLQFNFGPLENVMEGEHRPGHFNGVATIVSKLFHFVQPTRAYFGQKDLQQFAIVQQLVHDLSFDLELVRCPILREDDGLAMSSRNVRLNPEERELAAQLYQALLKGREMAVSGRFAEVKPAMLAHLAQFPDIKPEYAELADAQTLQPITKITPANTAALCLAAQVGPVRLIDNELITVH